MPKRSAFHGRRLDCSSFPAMPQGMEFILPFVELCYSNHFKEVPPNIREKTLIFEGKLVTDYKSPETDTLMEEIIQDMASDLGVPYSTTDRYMADGISNFNEYINEQNS